MTPQELEVHLSPPEVGDPLAPARTHLLEAVCDLIDCEVRLYSLRQVADLIGISPGTLKQEEKAGKIRPTHRFGPRLMRYSLEEVRRYVREHRLGRA